MKPVDQTRFSSEGADAKLAEAPGNCWGACIASILEVPLSEVPDEATTWQVGMTHRQSWRLFQPRVFEWLRHRGFTLVTVPVKSVFFEGSVFDPYCILSGPSPRIPSLHHAVVGQGTKIVHDPHPSRAGLKEVEGEDWYYEFFVPIDSSRLKRHFRSVEEALDASKHWEMTPEELERLLQ